jgi:N-acetyl sugar amidotransferase
MTVCSRCIYDSKITGIFFDDDGVCSYCRQIEELVEVYGTGKEKGAVEFQKIVNEMKKRGKQNKYDCVIGVSGGTDSSYLLLKAKEWGLRPLAVHYDNTWNSAIATENIKKVTSSLDIDLYTYVIDNTEADDIYRAFFLAGVPEFDASTDLALAQVVRMIAAKFKIRYIIEGHSFMTEGISPQANNYFDGKYIQTIHKKFGKVKMKTYPLMTFFELLKWSLIYRQKFIRPLWYLEYTKEGARKRLEAETGWKYYGGHHLENRVGSFVHKIYHPQKFNLDNRNWSLAANARAGIMTREEALVEYQIPLEEDLELAEYARKRMNLSTELYHQIMNEKSRSFKDFTTYKKRFETWRPLFFILAKYNLVPMSFYLKYCFPLKESQ